MKLQRTKMRYRWHDSEGWHVGWKLLDCHNDAIEYFESGQSQMYLMAEWSEHDPVFVPSDILEAMPTKDITSETRSTSLDAKPGTWESAPEQPAYQCTIQPLEVAKPINIFGEDCFVPESQLTAARAEANDLMQRLTDSQQEVAKLMHETQQLKEIRDQLWSDKKTLEHDNGLLERDRDEARQELAEVKAERDRLAAQVMNLTKSIDEAHQILDRA